jgi:hypothetical protein
MPDERSSGERRTIALRGQVAGSFTPPQSAAASNPCLNCGTNVQLDYCPECGQRAIEPDPTLREFLRELAEEFLHWDGKLLTTFRLLITRPGELTLEYLAGRRVRYISPLRVYLTCSVLYFFLAALAPQGKTKLTITDTSTTSAGVATTTTPTDTAAALRRFDSLAARRGGLSGIWGTHFGRAMRDPQKLTRSVFGAVPKAMFVLLPSFAGLFALAFRDRRRKYPQHLAFALHVHAVIFLGMIVMLVGRLPGLGVARTPVNLVVGGLLGAYLLLATRRVYEAGNAGTVARLLLVFGLYALAFAAMMLVLFSITVLTS